MIEKMTNNRVRVNDDGTHAIEILLTRTKLNELVDAVNVLEATLYGLDDDCDCFDEDDDLCPDCREELTEVNTTDGLFADFAAYVADNPGLRFWQALQAWSGYAKIYGEMKDGDLDDTFYKTTRGPKR